MVEADKLSGYLGEGRILLGGVPGVTDRGWLGYCTVFLFRLGDEWALFDTGHFADRHLLLDALSRAGVEPGRIGHVVLSHLHFDHCLNLPLFKNASVYVAAAEIDHAERVSAGERVDHAIPDYWPALIENRTVRTVEDELTLTDSIRLKVLPGHSPGTMAMFIRGEETIAVCGDVIKNAWEAVTGRSSLALFGEELAAASIGAVLDDARILIPGHDRPFRFDGGRPEYLSPFTWSIRTSLFPEAQDKTVLQFDLPGSRTGPESGASER